MREPIPAIFARDLRKAAMQDDAATKLAQIDLITDTLASLGYCRPRLDVDHAWLRRREAVQAAREAIVRRGKQP